MPTNFPSWGHGREGLESHFREKLQIPNFWSRVRWRLPNDVEPVPHVDQLEAGEGQTAALPRQAVHFGDGELLLWQALAADSLFQRGDGPRNVILF